ncbi:carbon-nitrogen hydrolase family protein [Brevibacterium sp. p3-SID960]|uniref:carbon-nitrogen hydrolase family protein n=1 Tax=Brevibacterium sp. p3-SID960 TaxID=2916063 RepID=UPI0021A4752B|nr:carbon-nitrogen hydrolase family protein [Brevibacterium sp. p3-SID960]MCT1691049.1 carbon-nitrogen hydrolase family protein [Brevibacterium sp. p3-SID960]
MKVAIAQINTTPDKDANLALIAEKLQDAAAQDVRLVVFPEATMVPFGADLEANAEELDGPFAQRLRELTAEAGLVAAVGMFRPGTGERVINTLFLTGVDSTGARVEAHYDKIHLFDAFGHRESDDVTPGETLTAVEIDGVTVGLTICYDIRFPALFTALAGSGAEVIVASASWGAGEGKVEQWQLLGRARALDSTSFVLACDQADPQVTSVEVHPKAPTGVGHSFISAPDGGVLAAAGEDTELLVAELDIDSVAEIRARIPVLENSRLEASHEVARA